MAYLIGVNLSPKKSWISLNHHNMWSIGTPFVFGLDMEAFSTN